MADTRTTARDRGRGATGRGSEGRRAPTPAEAFRAQLRFVFRRGWSLAVLAAVVAVPVAALAGFAAARGEVHTLSGLVTDLWSFPLFAGLFWPLAVTWREEAPSGRAYHWTLPVDRSAHQLLRAAAGWLHLTAGLAAGLLAAWALGAVLQGGMAAGRPGVLLGLFPSVTIFYLLGTVATIATEHPLVWIFVAYLAVGLAQSVAAGLDAVWLERVVAEVFTTGPLSLGAAASGPHGIDLGSSTDLVRWRPWRAVPLWIAVSAALAVGASRLHLERAERS